MLICCVRQKLSSGISISRCLSTVSYRSNHSPTVFQNGFPFLSTSDSTRKFIFQSNAVLFQKQASVIKQQYKLLSKDASEEELGRLLYVGKSNKNLKLLHVVYYTLSAAAVVSAPYLLSLASKSIVGMIVVGIHLFIFAVLNPILLLRFGKRYVNKLYYNRTNKEYTAEVLSPLLFKEKRLTFTSKDCKMPLNPSMFTSFYVGKHPLFINSDDMNYQDYMKMLRHAEDLDFENPDRQEQYEKSIEDAVKYKQVEDRKEEK